MSLCVWKCKLCLEESPTFYTVSTSGTTSSRKIHIKKAHGITDSPPKSSKTVKINFFPRVDDSRGLNEKLVAMVAEHSLAYQIVESLTFVDFVRFLNENAKVSYYKLISNKRLILASVET